MWIMLTCFKAAAFYICMFPSDLSVSEYLNTWLRSNHKPESKQRAAERISILPLRATLLHFLYSNKLKNLKVAQSDENDDGGEVEGEDGDKDGGKDNGEDGWDVKLLISS